MHHQATSSYRQTAHGGRDDFLALSLGAVSFLLSLQSTLDQNNIVVYPHSKSTIVNPEQHNSRTFDYKNNSDSRKIFETENTHELR
jgi:hypothetical protein